MATTQLSPVLSHLRKLAAVGQGRTDLELLHAYCATGDPDAFAGLVHRHGPLVWRVCRRVLGHHQDAEDAYQATFLVLARKATRVRPASGLAGWLHGVAYRAAMSAKRASARRRLRERKATPAQPCEPAWDAGWHEVQSLLHEEIERLPERYRQPFLLCLVEGLSRAEAARRLGVKEGTIWSRLTEARKRLQARLARRGVELTAVLAGLGIAESGQALPPTLTRTTIAAALDYAAGKTATAASSAAVAALVKGATATMSTLPLKRGTIFVLMFALLTSSAVLIARSNRDQDQATAANTQPAASATNTAQSAGKDRHGDLLPADAILRIGTVRYRAGGGGVNQAALSPDGRTLAATSEAGITLVDLATGQLRKLRDTHVPNGFDTINAKVAISADSKCAVNVTYGGNIRVYDLATGKFLRQFGSEAEPLEGVGIVAPPVAGPAPAGQTHWSALWYPPHGRYLVAGEGQRVHLLDLATGDPQRSFEVVGSPTDVSADGKLVVALNEQTGEAILYGQAGKELHRFIQQGMTRAMLGHMGKLLVTFDNLSNIRVWDTATGKKRLALPSPAPKSATRSVIAYATVSTVTPDGRTLLVGTQEGEVLRWDLAAGKRLESWKPHYGWVTGLFCTDDGKTLVSVSWDGVVQRTELATGKLLPSGDGYTGHIRIAASPDGRLVAAVDTAGRLDLWEMPTGRLLRTLRPSGVGISAVRVAPDGKTLAIGQTDGQVVILDTDGKVRSQWKAGRPSRPDAMFRVWFEALTFSPDGRSLCTSASDFGMSLHDLRTGAEVWHDSPSGRATFSPDGKTLVTGGWDKMLHFRDPATGKSRSALPCGPNEFIDDICFSPDGRTLATGHHGGMIYLRDPHTGRVRTKLTGFQQVAWDLSFSPDGKWLAAAGDQTIRLWELATAAEMWAFHPQGGRAMQAIFRPDGRTLLSSSFDLTALLWDLRRKPEKKRSAGELWDDLAGPADGAYRAIWALADEPQLACSLLQTKLTPARPITDPKRVRQLVAQLDRPKFREREAATKALRALGSSIIGELRQALRETHSQEVRNRLQSVLGTLENKASTANLRQTRAVQVLELARTPATEQLLKHWASGAADAPLTQDAQAALARPAKK